MRRRHAGLALRLSRLAKKIQTSHWFASGLWLAETKLDNNIMLADRLKSS